MTTKNFVVKNGVTTGNITLDALTNLITTTGNVSAANLLTGGQVSATGNITGNNLSIGNIISAGGNLTAGNITTVGNANLGNIITTGLFTSSGNVSFTGSNFYLSNVSNIRIPGGVANYVLTTNGSGNVSWEPTGRGDANVAGSNTELQFNDSGNLGASANLTFNKTSNTLSTFNVNISGNFNYTGPNAFFSNVSNLRIPGGTANYVLTTDGTGNVSWEPTGRGDANVAGNNTEVQFNNSGNLGASNAFTFNTTTNALSATYFVGDGSNLTNIAGANVTGTVANATHACTANVVTDGTQSNITAVGTLTSLSSSGNIAGANLLTAGVLSANGNVTGNYILGNGAFLTGVSTNSTSILNGNSNVVVEANSNVTVGVAGNANVVVFTGAGVNVTGYVDLTGNITAINANLGNAVNANFFIGSGNNLSNIQAANITGTVANANYAAYAGDVVNASQPNITSVGTLTSLSVSGNANTGNLNTGIISASGNLSATNANLGNAATANYFIGSGNNLSNIQGANVTGTVANATHASTANTVVDANQSNITSVGTLTNLSISGNANVGNNVNVTGNAVIAGNLVVGGNTVYINVETIRVEDPIIELGGGPNGDPLTSDDGKDRGTLLHYYAGAAIDAFMGWDESNTEFALGSNVTVTNDVVTFNTFGNLRLAGLIANTGNFSGNISAINANLGNAVTANFFIGSGNNLSNLQVGNVTGLGNIATLNIDGNSSNILYGNGVFASAPVTYGNSNVATFLANFGSNTISTTGNITAGNLNTTGVVSAAGNVAGNFILGNGFYLTGIAAGGSSISNGNSNVSVSANSNVTVSVGGTSNVATFTTTGLTITSNLAVSGESNLGSVGNVIITGGSNGYVLQTDGAGNLSWSVPSVLSVTVDDFTGNGVQTNFTLSTTPVNEDFTIVSLAGTFQPRNTYSIVGNVLTFSSAPPNTAPIEVTTFAGSAGTPATYNTRTYTGNGSQTIFSITSGSTVDSLLVTENGVLQAPTSDYTVTGANLAFTTAPANSVAIQIRELPITMNGGGGGLTWNIANSNITMTANNGYFVDTSGGAKTMTLPASASLGDTIRINDLAGTFDSNACTIARNGHLIQGIADDLLANTEQSSFGLVYSNSTYGWKILEVV
jgi:hypothetical protein